MQIYNVETQEDYNALMVELEGRGFKPFNTNVFEKYDGNCCIDTKDKNRLGFCDLKWYQRNHPEFAIEKYKAKQNDVVNSPNHYTQNGRETIENIRDTMSSEGYQGYCVGNVVKYLARYKFKNGLEDVRKAKKYIEFLEEELMKQED